MQESNLPKRAYETRDINQTVELAIILAPSGGFEPPTRRLTVVDSTAELQENYFSMVIPYQ